MRRSSLLMHLDVLQLVNDGMSKPTRIMHGSNIEWQVLTPILERFVERRLITVLNTKDIATKARRRHDRRTKVMYVITEKGEHLLRLLNEVDKIMKLS